MLLLLPLGAQFEEQQVSRFLVSVEAAGLPMTLVLNKADLVDREEVAARLEQCASWGYDALPVSCETGQGLERVGRARASGRPCAPALVFGGRGRCIRWPGLGRGCR